jgi:hypothetical protein
LSLLYIYELSEEVFFCFSSLSKSSLSIESSLYALEGALELRGSTDLSSSPNDGKLELEGQGSHLII